MCFFSPASSLEYSDEAPPPPFIRPALHALVAHKTNSSKNNVSIDFDAYQEWRKRRLSSSQPVNDSCDPAAGYSPSTVRQNDESSYQNGSSNEASIPDASTDTGPVAAEARYPTSFSHIVELITSGRPVPGIKDVPDTILSGRESPAVIVKRKKPWEQGGDGGVNSVKIENEKPS